MLANFGGQYYHDGGQVLDGNDNVNTVIEPSVIVLWQLLTALESLFGKREIIQSYLEGKLI